MPFCNPRNLRNLRIAAYDFRARRLPVLGMIRHKDFESLITKGNLMSQMMRKLELPIVLTLGVVGSAFLLKMCYMSLGFNTIFGILFLAAFYFYLRSRHNLRTPIPLLLLVFAALQIDALGNYFQMYGQRFGPLHYDEFSHMGVQALATPIIIWLSLTACEKFGYSLPTGLVSFFAATTMFSLSAFYEILEYWDEAYFYGQRIWGKYDTANDLQWDLAGILVGTLLANIVLRSRNAATAPNLRTQA